jgi:hypothetical protein
MLASAPLFLVAAGLFVAAFLATPTQGSLRFMELTAEEELSAYIAADPPPIRIGPRDEILVSRIPVRKASLLAVLSELRPGWDGKVISMAADRALSQGEVLLFARELREMGIERVYYVTPDNRLKLLSSARSST